jgi:hypothetical protein
MNINMRFSLDLARRRETRAVHPAVARKERVAAAARKYAMLRAAKPKPRAIHPQAKQR